MTFGKQQDPRLVTVRRGSTLRDADHHRVTGSESTPCTDK